MYRRMGPSPAAPAGCPNEAAWAQPALWRRVGCWRAGMAERRRGRRRPPGSGRSRRTATQASSSLLDRPLLSDELLHALPGEHLGDVEVAMAVRPDAVGADELSRLPDSLVRISEPGDDRAIQGEKADAAGGLGD